LLTVLEVAHALTVQDDRDKITLADAEAALALRSVKYGDDEHYDIVSAFIKSIRGSDPDAGLYWLARMLDAGEDARFVARRLVILASEDVGLADPQALLVADAAARAVEYVGLPEAAINLAHAVLYLSLAPKSNSVVQAIGAASEAVRNRRAGPVPVHLRDAHYRGAKVLGHGEGYLYPHDAPAGWVPQEHLPVEVAGERFYRPSSHGVEPELYEALRIRRKEDGTDHVDE
jgi:putative ATPase